MIYPHESEMAAAIVQDISQMQLARMRLQCTLATVLFGLFGFQRTNAEDIFRSEARDIDHPLETIRLGAD